jgi:hypothetical protein
MTTKESEGGRAGDYAIGYGRPPAHTHFRPGRPKGPKSVTRLLLEALEERAVVTTEDGKRRRVAKCKLGVARLADKFAGGDPCATRMVLDLLREIERRTPPEPAERPPLAAAHKLVIDNLLARLRAP